MPSMMEARMTGIMMGVGANTLMAAEAAGDVDWCREGRRPNALATSRTVAHTVIACFASAEGFRCFRPSSVHRLRGFSDDDEMWRTCRQCDPATELECFHLSPPSQACRHRLVMIILCPFFRWSFRQKRQRCTRGEVPLLLVFASFLQFPRSCRHLKETARCSFLVSAGPQRGWLVVVAG